MTEEITATPEIVATTPGTVAETTQSTTVEASQEPIAEPKWPDDWRETYAKDNEKKLNRLKRFTTPEAALDWAFEADKKLSSGRTLPANATPEQLASWRESMGVPSTPDDYMPLLKDLPITDADQTMIKDFLENSLNTNLTPGQVEKTLKWFYGEREKNLRTWEEETFNKDTADKARFDEQLHSEWGGAYQRNLAAIDGLLASAPESVSNILANGRLEDGSRVGNNPEVLNWLANIAMELNPAATVVPGAGANSMSQIDSELAAIEARMGGDTATRAAYYKDEPAQKRWRELTTAKESMRK
jgi:hypothetical protein